MKWVDGGKPLFKVSTFVVSTVNTQVSMVSEMSASCPTGGVIRCLLYLYEETHHFIGCQSW